ncbi:MAG: hypothetical protein PUF51_05970 [Bifidobacteriaceae bacterium]|nr:hypothetical protein [Bifidobacteriaceae bacterium]
MTYAIGPDVWTPRDGMVGMAGMDGMDGMDGRAGRAGRFHASRSSHAAEPRANRANAASDFADRVVRAGVARHGVLLVGEGSPSRASGIAAPTGAASGKRGNASGTGIAAMISKAFASLSAFLNAPITA